MLDMTLHDRVPKMKRFVSLFLLILTSVISVKSSELQQFRDPETQWLVIQVKQGETTVRLVPEAGCNVISIEFKGTELLRTPKKIADAPGVGNGVPILYPTPNRVRDAAFTFDDKTYEFPSNNGANFIHGLVHSVPWTLEAIDHAEEKTVITCILDFEPGTKRFELFPIPHRITMRITVTDGTVTWKYEVKNLSSDQRLPFGFALHPYFMYQQGGRSETYLTVPATHWMESKEMLPSGRLIPLGETELDARSPRNLEGFVIDDVYFGLSPERPVEVEFRKSGLELFFTGGPSFRHLVVYTPSGQPWFCVENQTCSTDAHNLYTNGLTLESGLQVLEPGKTASDEVTYSFNTSP
jgi:aldose 1-epimerase